MMFLVRDPRGVMNSRRHQPWCMADPDCGREKALCDDMVDDYKAAIQLLKEFPKTFSIVRYEDLSLEPNEVTKKMFQFYGLSYDSKIEAFLDSHTKAAHKSSWTVRNSEKAAFHWMKDSDFEEVMQVQGNCTEAMKLFGYKEIAEASQLTEDFEPLLPFNIENFNLTAAN